MVDHEVGGIAFDPGLDAHLDGDPATGPEHCKEHEQDAIFTVLRKLLKRGVLKRGQGVPCPDAFLIGHREESMLGLDEASLQILAHRRPIGRWNDTQTRVEGLPEAEF